MAVMKAASPVPVLLLITSFLVLVLCGKDRDDNSRHRGYHAGVKKSNESDDHYHVRDFASQVRHSQ